MPCLLLLVILFFPRVCLALLAFFHAHWFVEAFHSYPLLLGIAGFLFLPLATLVYVWMAAHGGLVGGLHGTNLIIIIVCVIIDISGWGGGLRSRR